MKNLVIIITALLLYSCGTTKKMTQTETHSKVNIESSFVDTSKRTSSWEIIMNSVINKIDLSKVRITTYYQETDSTGKQLIKEDIFINNNIKTIESKSIEEIKNQVENKGMIINNTLSGEYDSSSISTIVRKTIPLNRYFIIVFGMSILIFCLKILIKKSKF